MAIKVNGGIANADVNGLGGLATLSAVGSSEITNGTVALADLADLAQATFIGRAPGAGTGVPTAIATTTDTFTQYALLAGRSGGQVLSGGTAGGDNLALYPSSAITNDLTGKILAYGRIQYFASDATYTADVGNVFDMSNTYTLNFAGAENWGGGTQASKGVINISPTLTSTTSYNTQAIMGLKFAPTLRNTVGSTANLTAVSSVISRPTWLADTQTLTLGACADLFSTMNYTTANSGTLTVSGDQVAIEAQLGTVSSGATITQWNAFAVLDSGSMSGAVTSIRGLRVGDLDSGGTLCTGVQVGVMSGAGTNIGVDIAKPTTGTSNIGLRNAGPTVFTRTQQTSIATTTAITPDCTVKSISPAGAQTQTAAPTVSDGIDGQLLILYNTGGNAITLQDQATLAGSNLKLSTTTYAMGQRDSLTLVYSSTVGDWIEIARSNNL